MCGSPDVSGMHHFNRAEVPVKSRRLQPQKSLHIFNNFEDIDRLLQALIEIL